ncbi:uncharacterized protein K441DRAFT_719672 [Cenococcum geophilum 1.58]|uniref:uncharacterized protein n=1 Tax=Cenococcum geophilum 1.58 TaxID=794803 RepID=UPI00358EDB41|nr:hypothetical protein K441DRAFT_719672 [Cenococcum geophilum 1.58]
MLLRANDELPFRSVVGGYLHGSSWKSILRADTAATSNVSKKVIVLSTLSTLGLILLTGVSIVTPIGLYSTVSRGADAVVDFRYIRDTSPIGLGSSSRENYKADRLCGFLSPLNCPGQAHGTSEDAYISSVIPQNITDIFSSGSTGDRSYVAGAFDIQYRSYIMAADNMSSAPGGFPVTDEERKQTQSAFKTYQSFILNDAFDIVEGMIVNSKTGGVGLRNHTVPMDPGKGMEWTEGLLWIEPETTCISANLTIHYTLANGNNIQDFFLMDRGGFVNMTHDYPFINFSDPQARPELYARAYRGAVLNNHNLMMLFNETRNKTKLGKTYQFDADAISLQPNQVVIGSFPAETPFIPGFFLNNLSDSNLTDTNYVTSILSRGYGGGDFANISNIAVETGLVMGVSSRQDGGSRDPRSNWSAPIYSCATAMKAYIMDVSFLFNGRKGLASLEVTKAEPRIYKSNATTPLWAVENTGMQIKDVSPFWALVDDKYEHSPNMWTLRRDHLYLPAGSGFWGSMYMGVDSSPAAAPGTVLAMLYEDAAPHSSISPDALLDYGGSTNYPLYLRWQKMSQNPVTSQTILNLIWTDIMANFVMGARPTIGGADDVGSTTAKVRVRQLRDTIKYDMRYAIPGIAFLTIYILALVLALIYLLLGKARLQQLKVLLNQTSIGRAVSVERYKGASGIATSSTKEWVLKYGDDDIGIRKNIAQADTPQDNVMIRTPAVCKPLMQQGSPEDSERLSDETPRV